jgi:hypothetical protein
MFYPKDEIMDKIVLKSLVIKNIDELWKGFHAVQRANSCITWHPDELI